MRRTLLLSISSLFVLSFGLVPLSAYGYYQDKFNPNSRTFDQSNAGYYQNYHRYGRGERVVNFYQRRNPYIMTLQRRSFNHPMERPATGKPVFVYDPSKLSWAVYNGDGMLVRTGPGSSGRDYSPDVGRGTRTPAGVYHIYSKAGPYYRSKIFPKPRGGAPMPYAMFFRGGYAIHGSFDVPSYNASHGCVRILPEDAQWLSQNILSYGATVIIEPYH